MPSKLAIPPEFVSSDAHQKTADRPLGEILQDPRTEWSDIREAIKSKGGGACTNLAVIGAVNPSKKADERGSSTNSCVYANSAQRTGSASAGAAEDAGGIKGSVANHRTKTESPDKGTDTDEFDVTALDSAKDNSIRNGGTATVCSLRKKSFHAQESIDVMDFGVDHNQEVSTFFRGSASINGEGQEILRDSLLSTLVGDDGFMGWGDHDDHANCDSEIIGSGNKLDVDMSERSGFSSCCYSVDSVGWGNNRRNSANESRGQFNPIETAPIATSDSLHDRRSSSNDGTILESYHVNPADQNEAHFSATNKSSSWTIEDCEGSKERPKYLKGYSNSSTSSSVRRATWNMDDYEVASDEDEDLFSAPRMSSAGNFFTRQFQRTSRTSAETTPSSQINSWSLLSEQQQQQNSKPVKTHEVKRALLRASLLCPNDDSQLHASNKTSQSNVSESLKPSNQRNERRSCRSLFLSSTTPGIDSNNSGANIGRAIRGAQTFSGAAAFIIAKNTNEETDLSNEKVERVFQMSRQLTNCNL